MFDHGKNLGKYYDHHASDRIRAFDALNGDIHKMASPVGSYLKVAYDHRFKILHGFAKSVWQRLTQPFARHSINVKVCFAGSMFHVFSGTPGDKNDVAFIVYQGTGRCKTLNHELFGRGLYVFSAF